MTEEKTRRMVTGIVVGATALILTLLAVLISHIVTLCVQNNRMKELQAERARLEQLIDVETESAQYYASKEGLEYLAFQHGFVKSNGK